MIRQLDPSVDFETVDSVSPEGTSNPDFAYENSPARTNPQVFNSDDIKLTASDVLPRTSSDFDWKEGLHPETSSSPETDGMASVSVSPYGVGYLGKSLPRWSPMDGRAFM